MCLPSTSPAAEKPTKTGSLTSPPHFPVFCFPFHARPFDKTIETPVLQHTEYAAACETIDRNTTKRKRNKRYDLEFLGDRGIPDAVGVPFQSIRHLDLACFTLGSHVAGSDDGELDSRQVTMERTSRENTTAGKHQHQHHPTSRKEPIETHGRQPSDESWDEQHNDGGRGNGGSGSGEEFGLDRDERQRRQQRQQGAPSGGDYDREGSSRIRSEAAIFVLPAVL